MKNYKLLILPATLMVLMSSAFAAYSPCKDDFYENNNFYCNLSDSSDSTYIHGTYQCRATEVDVGGNTNFEVSAFEDPAIYSHYHLNATQTSIIFNLPLASSSPDSQILFDPHHDNGSSIDLECCTPKTPCW